MRFYLAAVLWLGCILFLQYVPDQSDFHIILPCLLGSFASYIWLAQNSDQLSWRHLLALAIVARICIIPAFPNLSDDIYRFIWDGHLWTQSIHPFSVLPTEVVQDHTFLNSTLLNQLNSKEYYSIYPPIAQFIFYVSTIIGYESINISALTMKTIHAGVDILAILTLVRLLIKMQLSKNRVFWYALNPLIIIELVGNLHHEGIVIFFMILTIYAVKSNWPIISGIALASAIGTKILPILFFPILFLFTKKELRIKFTLSCGIITLLLFALLIQDIAMAEHLIESANLYFQKFEFNASIYYVLRSLGYWVYGYNTIGTLGPLLSIISVFAIGIVAFQTWRNNWDFSIVFILLIWTYCSYAFLSATLHPWYISVLVLFSIFTRFRFPILWSGLIMLTYVNYSFALYQEQLWLVCIEYILVFSMMWIEIKKYGWLDSKGA